jgi:hypothetical protein
MGVVGDYSGGAVPSRIEIQNRELFILAAFPKRSTPLHACDGYSIILSIIAIARLSVNAR